MGGGIANSGGGGRSPIHPYYSFVRHLLTGNGSGKKTSTKRRASQYDAQGQFINQQHRKQSIYGHLTLPYIVEKGHSRPLSIRDLKTRSSKRELENQKNFNKNLEILFLLLFTTKVGIIAIVLLCAGVGFGTAGIGVPVVLGLLVLFMVIYAAMQTHSRNSEKQHLLRAYAKENPSYAATWLSSSSADISQGKKDEDSSDDEEER